MHLQQAIEKYVKGWLLDRGWVLRRTHEVDRLLDDATGFDPSLQLSGLSANACQPTTS